MLDSKEGNEHQYLCCCSRGLEKLVAPGGWVDICMTQGVQGIFELMKRGFDRWRFDREGQVEKELESRGVLDPEVLPYYPYRDDAIPLYNVIKKYVRTVVTHHYGECFTCELR